MNATAHVAQNTNGRSSAIDGRTTRHAGYAVSQRIRKRIEEAFGWIKKGGGQERTKFRGRERVGWAFTLAAAAYNLARLPKLLADRRFRSLGSSSSPSERPGDADDHRARRRNRLRRLGGRPRSRIRPRTRSVSTGPDARKAMRSRAKEPPNCSRTGQLRSSSPTETATKPSSKQNETLLQQPARRGSAHRADAPRRSTNRVTQPRRRKQTPQLRKTGASASDTKSCATTAGQSLPRGRSVSAMAPNGKRSSVNTSRPFRSAAMHLAWRSKACLASRHHGFL